MEETLSETNNDTEGEKAKEGRQLFSDIEKRDIRIRPKCQEAFIMRGSYHILANQLKIGWHVDFFARLKQLLKRDEQNRQKELPTNKANGNQKSLGHFKGAKTIAR